MNRRPVTAAATFLLAGLLASCGGSAEPEAGASSPAASPTAQSPSPSPTAEDARVAEVTDMLLVYAEADSVEQMRADADPASWQALFQGLRMQGDTLYVELQIGADEPDRDDLGTTAAKAVSAAAYGVEGVSWVVAEDATGTQIAQEQPLNS
ncbi:hypothetical protein ACFQ80_19085 [Isoptericola sp. NPDC056578]|uniref:hypothetical protein n=1 Tax=Isoptericola sp. NPDC056578 TaxID=3345870 RepID=UPI0036C60030